MNLRSSTALALALAVLSPPLGSGPAAAAEIKPRATHEQLAQRVNPAAPATSTGATPVPVEPGSLQKRDQPQQSLIARSTIISFGGFWTIVPKGAVLHVPAPYRSRVAAKPNKGRLTTWREFQSRNRGWIQTQNVKLSEARGETELAEATVETFRRSGRVVVAVFRQGPISLKQPPAKTTASR